MELEQLPRVKNRASEVAIEQIKLIGLDTNEIMKMNFHAVILSL